jgi:hypothetical protein
MQLPATFPVHLRQIRLDPRRPDQRRLACGIDARMATTSKR